MKSAPPYDAIAVDRIARTCHEVNRAYCQRLGDFSQVPWNEVPEWQRDSARNGVRAILADPSTTPEQSHLNWRAQKEAEGWVFGPVKDVELKQHPCMLPYDQLPAEQQTKDHLFGAVVRAHIDAEISEMEAS